MSQAEAVLVDSPQLAANEFNMCKNAAELLHKHYPGHLWAVSIEGSILTVRNLMLSGEWGFVLHIPAMYSASEWDQQLMRAGGEILERYRQRRAQLQVGSVIELPTDFSGRHKADA